VIVCEKATEDLVLLLRRCRTVLGNMAEENPGLWNELTGRRWPISHEPLRADAKNLIPLIDDVLWAVDI
jgi:hypothetical protein